ncbi:hypothetical protein GDO78_019969, partial [Eleutherodactylus coqui]
SPGHITPRRPAPLLPVMERTFSAVSFLQLNGFRKNSVEEVHAFLIDEEHLHLYDDLTKVNPVVPEIVLKCLQARYSADIFYTNAGCTVVAVNPFQLVTKLYSFEVMKEYHAATHPQVTGNMTHI